MTDDRKPHPPAPKQGNDVPSSRASDKEVADFIEKMKSVAPASPGGARGRLIFAMDATMSRQPTWDMALKLQADMFTEVKAIGGLDVQLIYFRSYDECRASKWVSDPGSAGAADDRHPVPWRLHPDPQGARPCAPRDAGGKVDALVYVGDCMEEEIDYLASIAGELGLLGVPAFMFQEGDDPIAETAFREIARLTKGAYCRFDAGSAGQLRELLRAVAAYAAGGRKALEDLSRKSGGGRRLLEQLKS